MKKIILSLLPCLFVVAGMFAFCNLKKSEFDVSGSTEAFADDSLRIVISLETVDSMLFIPNEGQPLRMDMADCKPLTGYLREAVYDTALNKSGIMMKMQAPDYTVVFFYKNKPADESHWLMIWKESGRTKFANEWYYLTENNQNNIYELLEKYIKPQK